MSRSVLAVLAVLAVCGSACGHHDDGPDGVVVTYDDRGSTVALAAGQSLSVELWNGGSAGFDPWVVASAPDPAVLALIRTERVPAREAMPGATGTDRFVFEAAGAGSTTLGATSPSHYGDSMTFQLQVVVRGAMR
jgi:hypothetical protein